MDVQLVYAPLPSHQCVLRLGRGSVLVDGIFIFRPELRAQLLGALLPEEKPCRNGTDDYCRDDNHGGCGHKCYSSAFVSHVEVQTTESGAVAALWRHPDHD